jgi:hypothetical protein
LAERKKKFFIYLKIERKKRKEKKEKKNGKKRVSRELQDDGWGW